MAELRPGDVIDRRYQVGRLIGSGGMATVFEVHDVASGRRLAMKVLHRQLLLHPVIPQRFLQEAKAASALDTPHAVKVEGTGNLADGSPYIVMEYLEGQPLNVIIEQKGDPFDPERVLSLADQVAQGIHEAHVRGIIHRDLKPENIFVIPTGQGEHVKVVDFGISKIFSAEDGVKLTQTGVTVGTPQYMPVEQLRGTKDLDGRVDVYALGVVMFEMLAGVRPYDGFTYEEVILKVATTTAPSLSTYRADLPPGLISLVDRTMARERSERTASMDQLRQEMTPYWSGRSPGAAQVNLAQTGGYGRPTAGRTQILAETGPTPGFAVGPTMGASPVPARTVPDHIVSAQVVAQVPVQPPAILQDPLAVSQASGAPVSVPQASSGPSKALIALLVIVAVGLLGLLFVIGGVAAWLIF